MAPRSTIRRGAEISLHPRSRDAWDRAAQDLESVKSDRTHGAGKIARSALTVLARVIRRGQGRNDRAFRARLRGLVRRLAKAQPAMGALRRWSEELSEMARSTPDRQLHRAVGAWLRREQRRLRSEVGAAVRTAVEQFPPDASVLTMSRSEAVRRTLVGLPQSHRPRDVRVLRSRPGGEGVVLARELRRSGLPARAVEDVDGVREVASSDLVLVGADTVFRDGTLVHKVGTRKLVEAARRADVPVLVVTGLSKFVGHRAPRTLRLPPLFDVTPGRWLRGFWTDRGFLRPEELRSRAGGITR